MRGYQNLDNGRAEAKQRQQKQPQFHCNWCTKKYRTQQKYDAHVDSHHPFAAFKKNTVEFTLDEKLWLLDELETYIGMLLQENKDTFVFATCKLGGELERMLPIHTTFKERIMPHLDKILSNGPQVIRIVDEFRAFLNLGLTRRGDNFCPSLLIDLVWHSAMQDKERYLALSNRFLGQPLPHCLAENDGDDMRFNEFAKQFHHQHGRAYLRVEDLIDDYSGSRALGILEARTILKREDELTKRKIAEQQARWRAESEQRQREIEAGTYVPPEYTDDGKC